MVGFEAGPTLGIITALAVLLHELPEGITVTGILLYGAMKRTKVFFYSLIVALATPLGAILSYLFLRGISPNIVGALLALAAGSFIYIAAADLIPETHKARNKFHPPILLAGALALALIGHFLA